MVLTTVITVYIAAFLFRDAKLLFTQANFCSHTSYNLNISGCEIFNDAKETKLPKSFHAFADSIQLDTANIKNLNSSKRFFKVDGLGTGTVVKLKWFEQSRSWLFDISKTGYVAEVYTIQTVDVIAPQLGPLSVATVSGPNALPKATQVLVPRKERWGVRVFREQWDELFSQNKSLEIGKKARWEPKEWQFFPPTGYSCFEDVDGIEFETASGFKELMKVLAIVERIAVGAVEDQEVRQFLHLR